MNEWYPSEGYHSRYSLDLISIFPRLALDITPTKSRLVQYEIDSYCRPAKYLLTTRAHRGNIVSYPYL